MTEPKCNCGMYQNTGTCYHTGYKPKPYVRLVDRILNAVARAAEKDQEIRKESIKSQ